MFSLTGKTALITGSSRGLGFTIARGLAKAGAMVILNGRSATSLRKAADVLTGEGLHASFTVFDVTKEGQIREKINLIENETGGIHILVNNAGIHRRKYLTEMTLKDWKMIIDINLTGTFLTTREVVKGMIKRKEGKIINICSLMSEVSRETIANYSTAKGGLKMLTRSMAVEWAKYNIQVNGIGPGYFKTDMTKPLADDPEFDLWLKKRTPAGRWGEPEELVGTAVYLASGASSFMNGQVIYVDGGFLASV
ncbi:MAG: gluconate 5-dehydrogenase [Bacteroides sp. SM23_62_1]|nr:MAG: gluconate 5-dehydrogenase [Bacteroides sp. SM23_62_1]